MAANLTKIGLLLSSLTLVSCTINVVPYDPNAPQQEHMANSSTATVVPAHQTGLLPDQTHVAPAKKDIQPPHATGLNPKNANGLKPNHATGLNPNNASGLKPNHATGLNPDHETGLQPKNSTGLLPQPQQNSTGLAANTN